MGRSTCKCGSKEQPEHGWRKGEEKEQRGSRDGSIYIYYISAQVVKGAGHKTTERRAGEEIVGAGSKISSEGGKRRRIREGKQVEACIRAGRKGNRAKETKEKTGRIDGTEPGVTSPNRHRHQPDGP